MIARLRVGVFGLTTPLLVGSARGIFADHGLALDVRRVASSEDQFRDLADGNYDVVLTAFDNVAHYHLNAGNALGRTLDVRAVLALDNGMNLSLVAGAHIRSIQDLRGRRVSVDSPRSGFAFVLYALLERAGIDIQRDVAIVSHGGVASRYARLRDGDADATLLSNGLEASAARDGLIVLGNSSDVVHPYLGSVAATADPAAAELAVRFRAAYEEARSVVFATGSRREAIDAVATGRDVPLDAAAAILDAELGALGLTPNSRLDGPGARNTLLLRARYDGFEQPVDADALSAPDSPLFA